MLARLCSKILQAMLSSTGTEDFLMAEKPKIKLPTLVGSWKKQGQFRKTSTSASVTTLKSLWEKFNNLRYADDTTLMTKSKEELYSLLMKLQKESEKVDSKLNIQKTKIMASDPITSWQIDGETMETVTDFIFWAPKSLDMVTEAMKLKDACSLKEKL